MPRNSFEDHATLLSPTDEDIEKVYTGRTTSPRRRLSLPFTISIACNIIFFGLIAFGHPSIRARFPSSLSGQSTQCVEWRGEKPVYSPAQDALTHVTKVSGTFTTVSEYSGPPSDEVDAAWKNLYFDYMISAVPREQAALLANQTERVPGDGEPRYVVGLDVFHQLHCLNIVRKALHPDRYHHLFHPSHAISEPPRLPGEPPFDHIDHCINSVRQSLMCNADVSPTVYQWDEGQQMNWARLNVPHTCTDFSKLQDWAKEWKPQHSIKFKEHVVDDWKWEPTPSS